MPFTEFAEQGTRLSRKVGGLRIVQIGTVRRIGKADRPPVSRIERSETGEATKQIIYMR